MPAIVAATRHAYALDGHYEKHHPRTAHPSRATPTTAPPPAKPHRHSSIYDMTFAGFVTHLRTLYGNDAVDMMLNGLHLMDRQGIRPIWTGPEPEHISLTTGRGSDDFMLELNDENIHSSIEDQH